MKRRRPAGQAFCHELVEPWLVDGQVAAFETFDTGSVDIETDHVVADVCETGGGDEPDVSGTDDGDVHRPSLAEQRRTDGHGACRHH